MAKYIVRPYGLFQDQTGCNLLQLFFKDPSLKPILTLPLVLSIQIQTHEKLKHIPSGSDV